jgi:hypothetical protein
VPGIIEEMHDHRALVDPLLKEQNNQAVNDSPQKLHTSLALLPVDPEQLSYLYGRLWNAGPTELVVIRAMVQLAAEKCFAPARQRGSFPFEPVKAPDSGCSAWRLHENMSGCAKH